MLKVIYGRETKDDERKEATEFKYLSAAEYLADHPTFAYCLLRKKSLLFRIGVYEIIIGIIRSGIDSHNNVEKINTTDGCEMYGEDSIYDEES